MGKADQAFGDRLRNLLHAKRFTQRKLAEGVGIASSAVTAYVHGRIPEGRILQRIAEALEVTMEYLLNGDVKEPEKGGTPMATEVGQDRGTGSPVVGQEMLQKMMDQSPAADWFSAQWEDARWKLAHVFVNNIFHLGDPSLIEDTMQVLKRFNAEAMGVQEKKALEKELAQCKALLYRDQKTG